MATLALFDADASVYGFQAISASIANLSVIAQARHKTVDQTIVRRVSPAEFDRVKTENLALFGMTTQFA